LCYFSKIQHILIIKGRWEW